MEVTLNPSWHLWIANFGTKRINIKYGTDICEYTRAFIKGGLLFLMFSVFCIFMVSWTSASLWNIVMAIFTDDALEYYSKFFLMITGILGLMIGLALFKDWWDNRPVKEKPEKPPTFAAVAYRKFKSKTCFRINFNNVE